MAGDSTPSVPRILVVDDDPALLLALPQMLRLRLPQVTIETCDSADAALDLLINTDYHVIISDAKMPGLGGIGLLREASKMRPLTPFILITGHGDDTMAAEATGLGAYLFIRKPLDRDSFALSVQRGLEAFYLRNCIEVQENTWGLLTPPKENLMNSILFVDGLPSSYSPPAVKMLFSPFGEVLWIRFVIDVNQYTRRFGYVEMATMEQASQAMKALNGSDIAGAIIQVSLLGPSSRPV
jgi:FixJ family two-component response regulator